MSEVKRYAERDLMALNAAGNHYIRHADAMTREGLHSKSAIAAELGWRDMQINALQQKLNEATLECEVIRDQIKYWNDKCRAVTAENAALKGFIESRCWVYDDDVEGYRDAVNYLPETPATDSIINALRAEALQEFAKIADEKVRRLDYARYAANDFTEEQKLRFAAAMFRGFARQLRAAQLRNGEHVGEEGV